MDTNFNISRLKNIIEGALLAAARPLDVPHIEQLFEEDACPSREEIRAALEEVAVDCAGRGFELKKVSSGYRFQVRQELSQWVNRLWEEKPQKYSRAMLETLALIAYRQPITRGDIEEIRGVSVSSQIIKTLHEREWIRVVGHRDVPGRPSLYATTKQFLDYFNLSSLEELPTLGDIRDLEEIDPELSLDIDTPVVEEQGVSPDAGEDQRAVEDSPEELHQEPLQEQDLPAPENNQPERRDDV